MTGRLQPPGRRRRLNPGEVCGFRSAQGREERDRSMAQTARMAGAIAVVALVASGVPALAQVKPGSQQGLGLIGADIPPILQQARADPYRAPAEAACEAIPREIMALNQALGPDVDALKTR